MEVIERKEKPFPEDLEGRLNAVLNVVNTELKTVTLLHLDDTPAEASEIRARIRETVGKGFYLPQGRAFSGYCHETLFPIGTVAEEIIRRESVEAIYTAYSLTESGKRYGLPVAVLALKFAAENHRSLFKIMGSTGSSGETRAPFNRVKMLKLLSEKGDLREADLVNETNLNSAGVVVTLSNLKKAGLIDYISVGEQMKGKGVITYTWVEGKNPKDVKTVEYYSGITKNAADLLKEKGRITSPKAAKILGRNKSCVCTVYSGLVRQGFAIRENNFVGRQKMSNVFLLDEARGFLDLERKIEDVLSGEITREEAQEIYLEIVNHPNYEEMSRIAIKCYKKVSPRLNKKTREETQEKIISLLTKNPGMRHTEIGRVLDYRCISRYLTPLVKSGVLRKIKVGGETRYFVAESPPD